MIGRMYVAEDERRSEYAEAQKCEIKFGGTWDDVEACEADFAKNDMDAGEDGNSRAGEEAESEQWGGLVGRGKSCAPVLARLTPPRTLRRSPGPGSLRITYWNPFAEKCSEGPRTLLHTYGARARRLEMRKVRRDRVVRE